MANPLLKQCGELTMADFDAYPIWVSCHIVDYDEPWYDETDEETVRPWLDPSPVDPSETMFFVRASFRLADGREFRGFITPSNSPDLGYQQPSMSVGDRFFAFWGGMPGVSPEERELFYRAVGAPAELVFPITYTVDPGLALGVSTGSIEGFYRSSGSHEAALVEC